MQSDACMIQWPAAVLFPGKVPSTRVLKKPVGVDSRACQEEPLPAPALSPLEYMEKGEKYPRGRLI